MNGRNRFIATLATSLKEILGICRSRDGVERTFRITKEPIKVRPIWNMTEEHIKAHLFVCFLASLLI